MRSEQSPTILRENGSSQVATLGLVDCTGDGLNQRSAAIAAALR